MSLEYGLELAGIALGEEGEGCDTIEQHAYKKHTTQPFLWQVFV